MIEIYVTTGKPNTPAKRVTEPVERVWMHKSYISVQLENSTKLSIIPYHRLSSIEYDIGDRVVEVEG